MATPTGVAIFLFCAWHCVMSLYSKPFAVRQNFKIFLLPEVNRKILETGMNHVPDSASKLSLKPEGDCAMSMKIQWETVFGQAISRATSENKAIFLDFFNPQ
ncbi:MAG: hypothetical protein HZA20_05660 [Nitrospirae bacterium]|nr:hypothetical protein [Nitrospirota bacterium]